MSIISTTQSQLLYRSQKYMMAVRRATHRLKLFLRCCCSCCCHNSNNHAHTHVCVIRKIKEKRRRQKASERVRTLGVNFINVLRMNFFERMSFFYVHVTRKSCRSLMFVRKICTLNVDEIDTSSEDGIIITKSNCFINAQNSNLVWSLRM
jgi:hypothetical protein